MATFYNQATLTYNGGSTNSNVTAGELVSVLSVTKQATTDTYAMGERITYAVSILNAGPAPYNALTLTDDLGAYPFGAGQIVPLTYVEDSVQLYLNGVLQADPTVTDTSPLTVSPITVPAGGNALLIYSADVNGFAPLTEGQSIANTVTVSGGGLVAAVTAEATVTAAVSPRLTISKSLSPAVVTENGALTYTFVIQNSGNTEAVVTDNVAISDTFDPALANLTVTLDGEALTEGTDYTYDPATGLFQTNAGRITVPAATYAQDPTSGAWVTTPGFAVLTVSGNIA